MVKDIFGICAGCRKRRLIQLFEWRDKHYTLEELPAACCICSFCLEYTIREKLLMLYCDRCSKAMGLRW